MEEKLKHSKRIRDKKKEAAKRQKVRSVIAKELITSGKYGQRIIQDKRGKKYDLSKMDHLDLVIAIQDTEDYGD